MLTSLKRKKHHFPQHIPAPLQGRFLFLHWSSEDPSIISDRDMTFVAPLNCQPWTLTDSSTRRLNPVLPASLVTGKALLVLPANRIVIDPFGSKLWKSAKKTLIVGCNDPQTNRSNVSAPVVPFVYRFKNVIKLKSVCCHHSFVLTCSSTCLAYMRCLLSQAVVRFELNQKYD